MSANNGISAARIVKDPQKFLFEFVAQKGWHKVGSLKSCARFQLLDVLKERRKGNIKIDSHS